MVKLMLDGFGGDRRREPVGAAPVGEIECYHVDARVSDALEDIGSFRVGKLFLLLRYCVEAIWCRLRYGVRAFYYVPAPGKRAALYRDWLVMALCRPFFRDFVYHWHAGGLGDWLERDGTWVERKITHWLLGRSKLGLALAIPSMRDALWFLSQRVELVPNGIPDPCPDFAETVRPLRLARLEARRQLLAGQSLAPELRAAAGGQPEVFRVLFLANLLRDKGIFDAIDAITLANARLAAEGRGLSMHLTVAGAFPEGGEAKEFYERLKRPDIAGMVEYAGFVGGAEKAVLLRTCDCLCFPSYYHAESFGLVVVEGMAAGMAVVTTRWRALPDLLPEAYPGLVPIRQPAQVAAALLAALTEDATSLRATFMERFTEIVHLQHLQNALLMLQRDDPRPLPPAERATA
jgi:glycosyltransferase involved in cell wall biosynthesis